MAASLFLPYPMPKAAADFTAILEEAFRAEVSAAFVPKVVTSLLAIAVFLLAGGLLYRYFKRQRVVLPGRIVLVFAILFTGMVAIQCIVIRNAQTARAAALAEIPDRARQASGLVQRLLADSTGAAVATESGTYLALAGDQIFLPKPVAEALQKALIAQNLRLP